MAGTFSESWYRVANVRAALRPTVRIRKQRFRGEWWYVLHDVFNNVFFRLNPASYAFISRLSLSRSVDEVWRECMDMDPDSAHGQVAALQLLSQFNNDNLLYFDTPTDSGKLFARQQKGKKREQRTKLMSFMSLRIALLDPDSWLERMSPIYGMLFGRVGLVVWLTVMVGALNVLLPRTQELAAQVNSVLAPGNLILLYTGMIFIKLVHEFGHGAACKHLGGEVHTAGIMFILFTPMPFVDATSSWSLRSRWHRALVGASGMIFELFIAALAAFVWAFSAPGIVHTIAYNMMFTASLSTLAFNANPLMKFDGYFIFSDLMDIPNLQTRARGQLSYLAERFLFGVSEAKSTAHTLREAVWMVVYGIGASIYKVFITVFIILFVTDEYLIVGALMAVMMLVMWLVIPPFKLLRYLAASPRLTSNRGRAVAVTVFLLVSTLGLSSLISIPNHFRAPGITESASFHQVLTATPGVVAEIIAKPGRMVTNGEVLVRLSNRELELKIVDASSQLDQVLIQEQIAKSRHGIQLDSVRKRKASIATLLTQLRQQEKGLLVQARQGGIWVAPTMMDSLGSWAAQGTQMGMVLDQEQFNFMAVISQEEAASLFEEQLTSTLAVRLNGQSGNVIQVSGYQIIPFQRENLPSAALGMLGGGDVAVASGDTQGTQSLEPFFLVRATLESSAGGRLLHGHSGKLRVTLEPQPLWRQLELKLRQFLQQRYVT
jgi:putative peptide zinc metalloprotease protein